MKKVFLAGTIAFSLLLLSATISQAQSTWNGGGAPDGNFGTAANWDTAPTSAAANTLDFAGSVGLNATNNNLTLNGADQTINFNSGASTFTIWGNGASSGYLRIGGVANNSSVIQIIMDPTLMNGTRTVNAGIAGLILGSPVGSTSTSGRTTTKTGAGDLIILGGTTVSGGSGYSVSTGALVFSNATAATLGVGTANGVALTANGTSLRFASSGTLSMSGAITTVAGSSITLNNSANVTVSQGTTLTGASLTGAGHLISAVSSVGGSIAPGNSGIGTIFVTSLTLDAASTTTMEINRAGEISDLISATGALTYGGTLTVNNIGAALQAGDSFDLFSGTISGTFASTSLPSLSGGLSWDTSQLNTAGIIDVTAVPEPATLALLGLGGLMAVWQIRRHKA